ncbi:hypothetical protein nvc1_143 [Namao virus]|nr:hypothetical protein nvc1_143 [Namao virus]
MPALLTAALLLLTAATAAATAAAETAVTVAPVNDTVAAMVAAAVTDPPAANVTIKISLTTTAAPTTPEATVPTTVPTTPEATTPTTPEATTTAPTTAPTTPEATTEATTPAPPPRYSNPAHCHNEVFETEKHVVRMCSSSQCPPPHVQVFWYDHHGTNMTKYSVTHVGNCTAKNVSHIQSLLRLSWGHDEDEYIMQIYDVSNHTSSNGTGRVHYKPSKWSTPVMVAYALAICVMVWLLVVQLNRTKANPHLTLIADVCELDE